MEILVQNLQPHFLFLTNSNDDIGYFAAINSAVRGGSRGRVQGVRAHPPPPPPPPPPARPLKKKVHL